MEACNKDYYFIIFIIYFLGNLNATGTDLPG